MNKEFGATTMNAQGTAHAVQPPYQPTMRAGRTASARTVKLAVVWTAYVLMVLCNAGFEVLKLGGVTSAEISDQVFAWFTPAGYVFAIWSVIYIGIGVALVSYTSRLRDSGTDALLTASSTPVLFAVSCALNIVWLALWHLGVFAPSLVVMVGLLGVLAVLYLRSRNQMWPLSMAVPMSLYFAWICVATIADFAHVITRYAGDVVAPFQAVSTIVLVVALLAASIAVRYGLGDFVYGGVVIWAAVGIGVRLMGASIPVAIVVLVLAGFGALAVYVPWGLYRTGLRG